MLDVTLVLKISALIVNYSVKQVNTFVLTSKVLDLSYSIGLLLQNAKETLLKLPLLFNVCLLGHSRGPSLLLLSSYGYSLRSYTWLPFLPLFRMEFPIDREMEYKMKLTLILVITVIYIHNS